MVSLLWATMKICENTEKKHRDKIMSKVHEYFIDKQKYCQHLDIEYIPPEPEVNVGEGAICSECGMDLPLPQPDDNY